MTVTESLVDAKDDAGQGGVAVRVRPSCGLPAEGHAADDAADHRWVTVVGGVTIAVLR